MFTDTNELKGFCAAKQSSIFTGKLVKISAQGHNWKPPEITLLFSDPRKISARAAAKQQKYRMKTLFHQLTSERSSCIFICTRKNRYQLFFCKKQHVFIVSRFWEKEIWNFKIYVNLTSGRNNSNSRGRATRHKPDQSYHK